MTSRAGRDNGRPELQIIPTSRSYSFRPALQLDGDRAGERLEPRWARVIPHRLLARSDRIGSRPRICGAGTGVRFPRVDRCRGRRRSSRRSPVSSALKSPGRFYAMPRVVGNVAGWVVAAYAAAANGVSVVAIEVIISCLVSCVWPAGARVRRCCRLRGPGFE